MRRRLTAYISRHALAGKRQKAAVAESLLPYLAGEVEVCGWLAVRQSSGRLVESWRRIASTGKWPAVRQTCALAGWRILSAFSGWRLRQRLAAINHGAAAVA